MWFYYLGLFSSFHLDIAFVWNRFLVKALSAGTPSLIESSTFVGCVRIRGIIKLITTTPISMSFLCTIVTLDSFQHGTVSHSSTFNRTCQKVYPPNRTIA